MSILIGLSVFLTKILSLIPMAVLYGVFMFMGVSALTGLKVSYNENIFFQFKGSSILFQTKIKKNFKFIFKKANVLQVGFLLMLKIFFLEIQLIIFFATKYWFL